MCKLLGIVLTAIAVQGVAESRPVKEPQVSLRVRKQFFKTLDGLLPKRASYHLLIRSMTWKAELHSESLQGRLLETLATSRNQKEAVSAYWKYWKDRAKTCKAKVVRTERSLSVFWEHGLTVQTYDHPDSKRMEPGSVLAEVGTPSFRMRLLHVPGQARTLLHLLHQTSFKEWTPQRLLQPLTDMRQKRGNYMVASKWAMTELGRSIRYDINSPELGSQYVLLFLDHATRLPQAAMQESNMIASVYSWQNVAKGVLWLDSLVQVRTGNDEVRVVWCQITKPLWNLKNRIQLKWPIPTEMLDTRGGRKKTGAFEVKKLPRQLRAIPWPALNPRAKK